MNDEVINWRVSSFYGKKVRSPRRSFKWFTWVRKVFPPLTMTFHGNLFSASSEHTRKLITVHYCNSDDTVHGIYIKSSFRKWNSWKCSKSLESGEILKCIFPFEFILIKGSFSFDIFIFPPMFESEKENLKAFFVYIFPHFHFKTLMQIFENHLSFERQTCGGRKVFISNARRQQQDIPRRMDFTLGRSLKIAFHDSLAQIVIARSGS